MNREKLKIALSIISGRREAADIFLWESDILGVDSKTIQKDDLLQICENIVFEAIMEKESDP